jgi:hypothetical protein
MSAHQMVDVVDDSDVALTLVIEEDPTRVELMATALRRIPELAVTVVDVQEGRMVLSLLQKLFQDGRGPRDDILAMLTDLRMQRAGRAGGHRVTSA